MKREPVLHEVCVFPREPRKDGGLRFTAYTLYFNPAWEGACVHEVVATSGALAKIAAIHAHKTGEGCNPNGKARP